MTTINGNDHALYYRYPSVVQVTVSRTNPPLQSHVHYKWLKTIQINKYKEKHTKRTTFCKFSMFLTSWDE